METRFKQDMETLEGLGTKAQIRNTGLFYLASEAVAGLGDRERILLRQHVVEGVPSTQLASLYQVHRATVSRWIVVAQETLLDSTRQRLVQRLQITAEELNSVLRLIQSQFETGIGDLLLGSAPQEPEPLV